MLHMKPMGIHNKETTMCILYTYVHMCKRKICTYRLHMHSSLLSELHCSSELLSKGYFLNKNKKQKKTQMQKFKSHGGRAFWNFLRQGGLKYGSCLWLGKDIFWKKPFFTNRLKMLTATHCTMLSLNFTF